MTYVATIWELVRTPFLHLEMVWGIVPLYFGWLVNELTSNKASYRTALQTGFSFMWAGANWMYHYLSARPRSAPALTLDALFAVNVFVTVLVIAVGFVALVSGLRRKYPPGASFLGHSRFANYFMILIFPIQSGYLAWSWPRLLAIALFAVPMWLVMHFGLKPVRGR
jgi:hypothetical protein